MREQQNYTAGIYCRLSSEDSAEHESMSIGNQDEICQGYFHHSRQVLFRMTPLFIENNRLQ